MDPETDRRHHLQFAQIDQLLRPGDVLVVNRTRVLKARLFGSDAGGRRFEVLLLSPATPLNAWNALVRPGKHIDAVGSRLHFGGEMSAEICRHPYEDRQFLVQFPPITREEFLSWLEVHGEVPLPPYLKRPAEPSDSENYQTVFAEIPGSVAAPTAGLHFTDDLLERLKHKGVALESILLQIGYGTFSPVEPEATQLHSEFYAIAPDTAARLEKARREGRRVIAVGTTVLRALESAATGRLEGETRIFIRPGHRVTQAQGLITNFHLPQSSLFILVCAWLGTQKAQASYREAIDQGYRFFSYGDAMAIL